MGNSGAVERLDLPCFHVFVGHSAIFKDNQRGFREGGKQAFFLYEGEAPCLTCTGADLAVRKKACRRRSLVSSAISAAALTFTTPRTVPPRRRCWRSLPTRLTTAAGGRSAPTVTPARCLGTGQPTATTTRPSSAGAGGRTVCAR